MDVRFGGRGATVSGANFEKMKPLQNTLNWTVGRYLHALMSIKSDSSSLSPVIGSVPFSLMYLTIKRRSYTLFDFTETTGSWGGSPDMAQKNMSNGKVTSSSRSRVVYPLFAYFSVLGLFTMSEKQQRLVLSIIDFLNQSIANGTVKTDDQESLEVAGQFCLLFFSIHELDLIICTNAVQCIGEAFGVDPSNDQQVARLSVKPATLQSIFDVYLKTKEKVEGGSQSQPSSSSVPQGPSAEDKAKAEKFKQSGNSLMSAKKYDEAIDAYSQAISLDSNNPIYYSNRAAAYSSKGDHLSAVGDAELALAADPKFVKAYHRLGFVYFAVLFSIIKLI